MISPLFKKKPSTQQYITIVSGLPRSGTSMMMQILQAGGIPILTDNIREADQSNEKGYLEYERVKSLPSGDTTWLYSAQGKAVKVISHLLRHLPLGYEYRVIFMRRNLAEIVASQNKMLNQVAPTHNDNNFITEYEAHRATILNWLEQQPNFKVLPLDYADVLEAPKTNAKKLARFLGLRLAKIAMEETADEKLRHHNNKSVGENKKTT